MSRHRTSPARRRELELADEGSGCERLQKVLAAAGLGSRRDCESLISEGRVEVDKQMVTELGTKVDPVKQDIRVDGVALHRPKKLYFALNKPPGVLCTNFDPSHRTRVIDLVPTEERVFPIGRLDSGSEGLILVTNDGELANRVTHPRYGLEKTYFVRVAGTPSDEELLKLKRGIRLAEGVARVVGLRVKKRYTHHTDVEIVLNEGKNRELRRVLAKVGHKVMLLRRTAVGPVRLGDLPIGACRKLLPKEVDALLEATKRSHEAKPMPGEMEEATAPVVQKAKPQPLSKPQPEQPQKPKVRAVVPAAPPKIDLAKLLHPQSAPKGPMIVSQPAASLSSVGDVISYETDDASASLPGYAAPAKPKKPKRGLEEKLALEREANPAFMLTQKPAGTKDHIIQPRDKAKKLDPKKKFAPGKSPRGPRNENAPRTASSSGARRSESGNPRSGSKFNSPKSPRSSSNRSPSKSASGRSSFSNRSPGKSSSFKQGSPNKKRRGK